MENMSGRDFKIIKKAVDWVLGGHINNETDTGEPVPSIVDLVEETYKELMDDKSTPREIRFCGKENLKILIECYIKMDAHFKGVEEVI